MVRRSLIAPRSQRISNWNIFGWFIHYGYYCASWQHCWLVPIQRRSPVPNPWYASSLMRIRARYLEWGLQNKQQTVAGRANLRPERPWLGLGSRTRSGPRALLFSRYRTIQGILPARLPITQHVALSLQHVFFQLRSAAWYSAGSCSNRAHSELYLCHCKY